MSASQSKAALFQIIDDCAAARDANGRLLFTDAGNLLLRRILGHDSGEGCWNSAATLAEELGWSLTKVRENLRELHERGLIWVKHERGGSIAVRRINWPTLQMHRR